MRTPSTIHVPCPFQHNFCPSVSYHVWILIQQFHILHTILPTLFLVFWSITAEEQMQPLPHFGQWWWENSFCCFWQRPCVLHPPLSPRSQPSRKLASEFVKKSASVVTLDTSQLHLSSFKWIPLLDLYKLKRTTPEKADTPCLWKGLQIPYLPLSRAFFNRIYASSKSTHSLCSFGSPSFMVLIDHRTKYVLINYLLSSLALSPKPFLYYLEIFSNYLTIDQNLDNCEPLRNVTSLLGTAVQRA